MELVTVIIGGTVLALAASLAYAVKIYQEIKRKNVEIEALRSSLNGYVETYSFEKADEELVLQCQAKIKELFHGDIEKEFNKYNTLEAKKAFANRIVTELAQCMNLKIDKIVIDDLGPFTRGVACHDNNTVTIYLNEVLLVADPQQLVKTMCHELKHCVQFEALTNDIWGYSPQRIGQYLYSMEHYVQCEYVESYEGYVSQIVEIDANKFVDEIFKA